MAGDDEALEHRWRRASRLVAEAADVIAERPEAAAPGWVERRGWRAFLAGLSDAAVVRCEVDGFEAHAVALGAPADLRALADEARAVCALPPLGPAGEGAPRFRVGARKQRQLAAFAAAVGARIDGRGVRRVVDVGAGHGHLTRHLATALRVEALGLERDPARVETARALAGAVARFEAVDLFADGAPGFEAGDLVVGLHACGALTDALVERAAAVGAGVAFASCCLQKRPEAARSPLVADGPLGATALPRAVLGLGNVAAGAYGVEASREANAAARARRAALRVLLHGRGLAPAPGDEMRGINRRRAHGAFEALAAQALALRGLAPASAGELRAAEAEAARAWAAERRWALARRMFGRVLEVQVNLDRAVYLARAGYAVEVGALWAPEVSPRNIGVIALRCGRPGSGGRWLG